MKKLRLYFTILLFSFCCLTTYSQSNNIEKDLDLEIQILSFDSLVTKVNEYNQVGKNVKGLPYFYAMRDSLVARNWTDSLDYPEILNSICYAYELQGDYEQAEIYYKETLTAYEGIVGEEHPNYITQLSYYGDFLKVKGDYEAAQPILEEAYLLAKHHKDEFEDKVAYMTIFGLLGNFYRQAVHEYEKALPLYLEEQIIFEKEVGEDHLEYGAVLSNIGTTYRLLGSLDKSLEFEEKSVTVTEKHHGIDNFQYGQRANNLALTYSKIKGHEMLADSFYQISTNNVKQLMGEVHPQYAIRLFNYATFLYSLASFKEAKILQEQSRDILSKYIGVGHPIWTRLNITHSKILWELGEIEKAKLTLTEALQYEEDIDFRFKDTQLSLLAQAEWLFEALGLEALTPQVYKQRNAYNTNIILHQFDYFSEYQQRDFAKTLEADFDRLESYAFRNRGNTALVASCFNNQLLLKGLSLRNKQQLLASMQKVDSNTLSSFKKWQQLKQKIARQYALPPAKRAIDFQKQIDEVDALENDLARASQRFKERNVKVSWKDIATTLKEGEVAIEFSHFGYYPDSEPLLNDSVLYVAYLLKKGMSNPMMIPLFEEKKLGNVRRTKTLYQFDNQANKNTLHQLIWQPLADVLQGSKKIYFTPSGILNRINLGAIPIAEKELLADRFELYQLGSTRQLMYEQKTAKKSNAENAVVFGGILYESQNQRKEVALSTSLDHAESLNIGSAYRGFRKREWEYLEWTGQEAFDIQALLKKANKKSQVKTAHDANEAAFKQLEMKGASPKIIHLATHAYFFPKIDTSANAGFQSSKNPLIRSGLILAGANAAWTGKTTPEGEEDGILTAYEIAQMDLSNTELVVLSACDTGLGEIAGDEGVYGLQRAFKMAGVKYILMSLWSVKDQKTYEFMTTFYEHLMEHDSIPAAYRFAQKRMQEKYALPFNPRNWAGFVLVE